MVGGWEPITKCPVSKLVRSESVCVCVGRGGDPTWDSDSTLGGMREVST